jgi:2-polyprenyl-6-methoxyphenol hydroxylase-like FAD-dependent oxidoreductase
MSDTPVLVVGAGPTGLTAAMELSRLGVGVRIVDRAAAPSTTSRALGVQARTLELLRPRGIGDEMLRWGNPAQRTALYTRGERIAAIEFGRMATPYPFILLLAQAETERLLTAQLQRHGVKVERQVEVVDVRNTSSGTVSATLRGADGSEESVTARYLIAADGSHSALRTSLGLPFAGRTLDQDYVLGDVRVGNGGAGDPVPTDQLSIFLSRRGFLAVFPLGDGLFRFMATDPDGLARGSGAPTLADIQRLWDRTAATPATLSALDWSSRFRINSRHLAQLRCGQVFFGGDAAHVHSPAGGQGMNTGIQDMINLSWKLAMVLRGAARPELLDTYHSDRLPVIEQVVSMTERATRLFNSTNPLAHLALTRLAPLVLASGKVQAAAAPRLGQLAAGYTDCPIAVGGGGLGTLRAGQRVPDAPVRDAQGRSRRLYDLLDLSRLTLVTRGRIDDTWRAWTGAVTRCELGSADTLFDGTGWLLVRPDGYLAAAGRPEDTAALANWLDRWFVPAR